jgi:hypothetical protein
MRLKHGEAGAPDAPLRKIPWQIYAALMQEVIFRRIPSRANQTMATTTTRGWWKDSRRRTEENQRGATARVKA